MKEGVKVEYSVDKLRLLASKCRGTELSTEEVEAFLFLFKTDLEECLHKTVRTFISEKLKK